MSSKKLQSSSVMCIIVLVYVLSSGGMENLVKVPILSFVSAAAHSLHEQHVKFTAFIKNIHFSPVPLFF